MVSFRINGLATCLAMAIMGAAASPVASQTCAFAPVKAQIDVIIDKDAALGARFRKEFNEGSDSIAVLESLVNDDMRDKIDICRFDVAEYLTKRGFPPPH